MRNHMEGWMLARNCSGAGVFVAEKDGGCKAWACTRWASILRILAAGVALAVCTSTVPRSAAQEQAASAQEVQQLRKDVNELRETVKRLEALLEARPGNATAPASAPPSAQPPAAGAVQPAPEAVEVTQ